MRPNVTVLGLGPMGRALAGAFLANGHETTVWNRTPGKAGGLPGVVEAATITDAVTASDLVVACVRDTATLREIVDPATEALRGRTLVNLSSDTPDAARLTATCAAEHGVEYLDGAIMTPTATIGTPAAVFLYSGPEQLFRTHEPTLAALGGTATYLGADPGRAAAHDLALLDLFWSTVVGTVHAFRLARTEKITGAELAPFAHGISALLPMLIDEAARQLDTGEYDGSEANIASAVSTLDHVVTTSEANGLRADVPRAALDLFRRAVDAGHGADSIYRVAEHLHR
jgi:3-hydroxyisobutyrate dehydrogenase-like beta-hydroxyacid dehydrogenase